MWYEWLIFAIVFLLIPIAVANLKLISEKRINPTEEQKKNANLFCGFLMLFYWLCDLFYMAFILDSLALKLIFGGFIMLIIFYNLSKAFISGASHFKWGLIQDFIVGVGMSIYLIYIIPSSDLKEVVIPIVSAVYGGLITLVGVAWTIRKADKDRKAEESKAIHPWIYPFSHNNDFESKELLDIHFADDNRKDSHYIGMIKNTDNGILLIKEMIIDGITFPIDYGDVLDKNRYAQMMVATDKSLTFDEVLLIGTDVRGNPITYQLFLNREKHTINRIIEVKK